MFFKNSPYYHQTIKRLVISFGQLFSGFTLIDLNDDGSKQSVTQVPISYGPKEKWLNLLKERPDLTKATIQTTLPRMSFEIVEYHFDYNRKIGTQGNHLTGTLGQSGAKLFNPVPYDVMINLYSLTKNQDDSLQILEQILPYFSPALNLEVEVLPEFGIKKNIPIVLNNVVSDDTYDQDISKNRTIIQTFSFTAKLDLFGPYLQGKVIKQANVNSENTFSPQYQVAVSPKNANKNDNFVLDEKWT